LDDAPPIREIHLGTAIALRGGGLVAPAIENAHALDLDGTMAAFQDLVTRARNGKLRASEMGRATITVTSLGERGVETVFPVIIPPQVTIVGFGASTQRPVVVAGTVVARPAITASLAGDHRVTDGHRGGLFLASIAKALMTPEKL
jgi:pyruvate dehydrogenase E2 component (dihydrolipoamide acetyltransferase)